MSKYKTTSNLPSFCYCRRYCCFLLQLRVKEEYRAAIRQTKQIMQTERVLTTDWFCNFCSTTDKIMKENDEYISRTLGAVIHLVCLAYIKVCDIAVWGGFVCRVFVS
jgi:hypothetical protein